MVLIKKKSVAAYGERERLKKMLTFRSLNTCNQAKYRLEGYTSISNKPEQLSTSILILF